jgi:hypothetical protein
MVPINPLSRPAGHPAATESPADAPGKLNIESPHVPGGRLAKSSTAAAVRYVGTEAESTATTVCVPLSRDTIPVPLPTLRVLRNARLSLPPFASHKPFVAVHVKRGIDPGGKAVTLPTAPQTPEQVNVRLCPAASAPEASMYKYRVPLPDASVIVLLLVTE